MCTPSLSSFGTLTMSKEGSSLQQQLLPSQPTASHGTPGPTSATPFPISTAMPSSANHLRTGQHTTPQQGTVAASQSAHQSRVSSPQQSANQPDHLHPKVSFLEEVSGETTNAPSPSPHIPGLQLNMQLGERSSQYLPRPFSAGDFRERTVYDQERSYRVGTNAPARSRKLHLDMHGNDINFVVVSPTHSFEIATLNWKRAGDIFSLYGDRGPSPHDDNRLCGALKRLGACFVVDLFEKPWNDFDVESPVVPVDLGDGQFIDVTFGSPPSPKDVSKPVRRRSDLSFDDVVSRHELDHSGPFIGLLRAVEIKIARQYAQELFGSGSLGRNYVASVIGEADRGVCKLARQLSGVFCPTVPTLYGLISLEFSRFSNCLPFVRQTTSTSMRTSSKSTITSSDSGSEADVDFGPDLEHGVLVSRDEETILSDSDQQEPGDVTLSLGESFSGREVKKTQDSWKDEIDHGQQQVSPRVPTLNPEEPQTLEGSSEAHVHHVKPGPLRGLLGLVPGQFRGDDVIDKDSDETLRSPLRLRLRNKISHHQKSRIPSKHPHSRHVYRGRRQNVAKEVLTFLLFTLAAILAVVTVALDPAGEENWFKRMEEGVFVLFSLGVPIILAMKAKLTDNLYVVMPAKERKVRSLADLKNQKKGIDDERFLELLSEAILVDEEISMLFTFENACYKNTREDEDEPLVFPNTVKYIGPFKEVWMFGKDLCFNKLTGAAFRYIERGGMLMIEKRPAGVHGVMVHTRKRHEEYRIGESLGK